MTERTYHTDTNSANRASASKRDLSWWLDNSIRLPGGGRIGLDGLIGLIPGVGDVIGASLSSWIFFRGYQAGLPKMVLARMVINILIDTLIGAIPIIGDLFDFVWKSNSRNARLMEQYKSTPQSTHKRASFTVIVVTLAVLLGVLGLLYVMVALISAAWQALT